MRRGGRGGTGGVGGGTDEERWRWLGLLLCLLGMKFCEGGVVEDQVYMLHINSNLARETLVIIVPHLSCPIRPSLSRTIRLFFQPIFPIVEVGVSPN